MRLITCISSLINIHCTSTLVHGVASTAVHEMKMTLPLRREKGHHNCGEIEIELNDLHMQLSSASTHERDNRTVTTAGASSTGTQNGPTSTAANSVAATSAAVGAATVTDDLMQLDTPQTERRAGNQSPAATTPNNTTTTATSTAGTTSTASETPNSTSRTDRQAGLAVAGTATVAALGGAAAAVGAATGGTNRVVTPTPSAPTGQPQRTPTPSAPASQPQRTPTPQVCSPPPSLFKIPLLSNASHTV